MSGKMVFLVIMMLIIFYLAYTMVSISDGLKMLYLHVYRIRISPLPLQNSLKLRVGLPNGMHPVFYWAHLLMQIVRLRYYIIHHYLLFLSLILFNVWYSICHTQNGVSVLMIVFMKRKKRYHIFTLSKLQNLCMIWVMMHVYGL